MVTRIRERTGTENSQHVTDDEIARMVAEGWCELYEKQALGGLPDYAASHGNLLPVSSGSALVQLPTDFFILLALTERRNGSFREMHRADPRDQANYLEAGQVAGSNVDYKYSLGDLQSSGTERLYIWPTPAESFTVELSYLPHVAPVSGPKGYNGVNGWEDFVLWKCAAQVYLKGNDSEGFAMAKTLQTEASTRIDTAVAKRDAAEPQKIRRPTRERLWPKRWID